MKEGLSAQEEFDAYNAEYAKYIQGLKSEWLSQNRIWNTKNVYETMSSRERDEVHGRIGQWSRYITPLAEAWWAERGYSITWPEDDSDPVQICKLQTI